MRSVASLLVTVAAIVIVAPGAGAHLGAVDVETSQARDTPAPACIPVCEVQSTSVGNAPAGTVLTSGANVTWTEVEGSYHTATSDDG